MYQTVVPGIHYYTYSIVLKQLKNICNLLYIKLYFSIDLVKRSI